MVESSKGTPHEIIKSRYGMLEIFRAAFNRSAATITLRALNRKFYQLAKDNYLDNFNSYYSDQVLVEVRQYKQFELLESAHRYCQIINTPELLAADFYYDFPKSVKAHDDGYFQIVELAARLANLKQLKMLSVGSGNTNRWLPSLFISSMCQAMASAKTKVKRLELDLEYYADHKPGSKFTKPTENGNRMGGFPDAGRVFYDIGTLIGLNPDIESVVFLHCKITRAEDIRSLFAGLDEAVTRNHPRGLKKLVFQESNFEAEASQELLRYFTSKETKPIVEGITCLEFWTTVSKSLNFIELIKKNETLVKLIISNVEANGLNQNGWQNYAGALLQSKATSQLVHFHVTPFYNGNSAAGRDGPPIDFYNDLA